MPNVADEMRIMQYQTSAKTLTRLGSDVESTAHRSLEFLNAIENTIDALSYDQKVFGAFADIAHKALDGVRQLKSSQPIDSDGAVGESFLKAQIATKELYNRIVAKRQSAVTDARLTEEDGVGEEYQRLIDVITQLHDCLNELRWAIGEHDADLCESHGPVLASPEAIERQLQ